MTRTRLVQTLAAGLLLLGTLTTARAAFATGTTLVVNGKGDLNDLNPGDGICDVTTNLPGSQCSLRAAVQELNALGPDATPHRIEFDIAGTGPFTITLETELPEITVSVEIDGAPLGLDCPLGPLPAELMIVLDGPGFGDDADGLVLGIGSDGSTVRGLVIGNFARNGILIHSDDNQVRCNHVGVGVDGVTAMSNGHYGILVNGDANVIGGPGFDRRNVISGNIYGGIYLSGDNNEISNNFVGTTADGQGELGNGGSSSPGVFVAPTAEDNTIGGWTSFRRNVIADHTNFGILVRGAGNTILGNYIGVARDGISPLPNIGGVSLEGDANVLGGTAPGEANRIAHNDYVGVRVAGSSSPVQNEMRGNAIFDNEGLGIDLGADGVDGNDPGDGDNGENERQNHPVLAATPGSFVVQGAIDGFPFTTYSIDVYRNESCDPSGYGEGEEYLVTVPVATGGSGEEGFLVDLTGLVSQGDVVTATATDPDGNTSEFSACVTMSAAPTPTSTSTSTVPPTNTPAATLTWTPGPSPTPTWTATPGPSPTPTSTYTPGPSPTPTWTGTPGPSPTATATFTPGPSPTPTTTGSPGASPTPAVPPAAHRTYLSLLFR